VLRFAIYIRTSFCITSSDIIFFHFFHVRLVCDKMSTSCMWQNEGTEHVICARFIPFWTVNSWISGGVRTVPGGSRQSLCSCRRLWMSCQRMLAFLYCIHSLLSLKAVSVVQLSCIHCVQPTTVCMDEPEVYSGLSLKPLTNDRSIFRRTCHTERAFDVLNTLRR